MHKPFEVTLTEYSLLSGEVGKLTGRKIVWSRHKSPAAAGRALGSLITGKNRRAAIAPRGMAYRLQVINADTGAAFARNDLL